MAIGRLGMEQTVGPAARTDLRLWEPVACDTWHWESRFLHPNRSADPRINMFSASSAFRSAFAISLLFLFFFFLQVFRPAYFPSFYSIPTVLLNSLHSFSTLIHPAFRCNATFNVQLSTANNFISHFSLSGPSFFTSFERTPIRLPT